MQMMRDIGNRFCLRSECIESMILSSYSCDRYDRNNNAM